MRIMCSIQMATVPGGEELTMSQSWINIPQQEVWPDDSLLTRGLAGAIIRSPDTDAAVVTTCSSAYICV